MEKVHFLFFGKNRKEAKQEARDEDSKFKIEIPTWSSNRPKMDPKWDQIGTILGTCEAPIRVKIWNEKWTAKKVRT